jgi:hypothetical protein
MSFKKIILSALLLSMLTAATAGYRWWKDREKTPALQSVLPSAPEELQKLIQRYRREADSSASVAGTIRIYDRENKDLLKESRTFRYIRCGMGYYVQLSSLQIFCDGIWLVQLDSVNRQIVVEKAPPGGPGGMMNIAAPPETFFSDTARFRISGVVMAEGDQRSLRLQSELNPEIRSSTLFYDTLSYQLSKAEIERWKPGTAPDEKGDKIWLVKIDYRYPPAEKMDLRMKIKSIVAIDGRRVTPGAAYRDYELNANNN